MGQCRAKLGEVALVAAIPGQWIDAFLLMAVTVTLALLALVMLS